MVLKGFDEYYLEAFIVGLIDRYELNCLYWITSFDTPLPAGYEDRIELVPTDLIDKLTFINWNEYDPIDNELILSLKETESIVMTMFERSYGYHHSYIFRRRSYLQMIRFWYTLVERSNFQGYICDILPHAPLDYSLYGLCEANGYSKLFFDNILPGFVLSWKHWAGVPLETSERALPVTGLTPADLSERAKLVYQSQTGGKDAATPYYMDPDFWKGHQKAHQRRQRERLLTKPRSPEEKSRLKQISYLFLQAERYLITKFRHPLKTRSLKNQLDEYTRAVDPTEIGRYFYLALHMQPEVSSGPRAAAYVDQVLIVEQMAACVPDDVTLIVKENPKQNALYRDRNFYRDLSRLRNVVLVPMEQNTFDLIEHCQAVVTGTGTAGWEAIFRGVPVINFGYPFYQGARGVKVVMTTEEVGTAVSAVLRDDYPKPTLESSLAFLKLLDDAAIYGNISGDRERLLPSPAATVADLLAAVTKYLG